MDKKTLRKELEAALIKSIDETLDKQNAVAGKKIKKKVQEASKSIAKKFYKTIEVLSEMKPVTHETHKKPNASPKKVPAKKTAAKAVVKSKK